MHLGSANFSVSIVGATIGLFPVESAMMRLNRLRRADTLRPHQGRPPVLADEMPTRSGQTRGRESPRSDGRKLWLCGPEGSTRCFSRPGGGVPLAAVGLNTIPAERCLIVDATNEALTTKLIPVGPHTIVHRVKLSADTPVLNFLFDRVHRLMQERYERLESNNWVNG